MDPELVFHAAGWDDELLSDLAALRAAEDCLDRGVGHGGRTTPRGSRTRADCSRAGTSRSSARVRERRRARSGSGSATTPTRRSSPTRTGSSTSGVEYERGTDRVGRGRSDGEARPAQPGQPDRVVRPRREQQQGRHVVHTGGPRRRRDLADAAGHRSTGSTAPPARCSGRSTSRRRSWDRPSSSTACGSRATATASCTASTSPTRRCSLRSCGRSELGGCIEATPAVWKGRIYVGTRAGLEYALG